MQYLYIHPINMSRRQAIIISSSSSSSISSSQQTAEEAIISGISPVSLHVKMKIYVCIVVLYLMVAGQCPSSSSSQRWQVNAEATSYGQQHDSQNSPAAHPPVYVDTKYWIRSTEFGERYNWLNHLRPCHLFERIKMNEQSVVSMGGSMDTLAGNIMNANIIKELTLAQNGMLLLEEDLPEDPIQSAFIDFLKTTGYCVEGDSVNSSLSAPTDGRHLFEFEPDSDEMSWFNPDNWRSSTNENSIEYWIPESHRIPCSEDIVVFGDRHNILLETNFGERDKTISFKVNFRASNAASSSNAATSNNNDDVKSEKIMINSIDSLRVSKLIIGERQYDQQDFDKLISSDDYRDILFQFNDSKSALKQDYGGYTYSSSSGGSPLTIDESSLVRDSSQNICLDEAGCVCGNERPEMMKVVCSFHEPLNDNDLPCLDPIYSAGYCNKICATSLTIGMDPSRFSERFLNSIIEKLIDDDNPNSGSVLVGPRRIDDDKYEIVFRYIPHEGDGHWSSPGVERNYAQDIKQQLEKGSTKSFYGIKTITTKSSLKWRQNNRKLIFWLTATSLSLISVAILSLTSDTGRDYNNSDFVRSSYDAQSWLNSIWGQVKQSGESVEGESFVRFNNQTSLNERANNPHGSLSNIPLMELDENDNSSIVSDK